MALAALLLAKLVVRSECRFLAHFGHGAMSAVSPLLALKRRSLADINCFTSPAPSTVRLRRSLPPIGRPRAVRGAEPFRLRRSPRMRWIAPLRLPTAVRGLLERGRQFRSVSARLFALARVQRPSKLPLLLLLSGNRSWVSTYQLIKPQAMGS